MDILKFENRYWNKGFKYIAGIDEAGRGPLAGPVVAACVVFEKDTVIEGIKDSKKLSSKKRDILFDKINEKAFNVGIGIVHENIIDKMNILKATHYAMKCSLGDMSIKPDIVLIDGLDTGIKHYKTEHIVNGDNLSHSIAAASIIAKVTRDRIMLQYDKIYPNYKFINHKGYGTKYHMTHIKKNKATIIHRKSFKIVHNNLPTVKFISNNYGFTLFGKQYLAVDFIKRGYKINNTNITLLNNYILDFHFIKDGLNIFSKVYTKINNNIDKYNKLEFKQYVNNIIHYLNEKDIRINFSFNVILVSMIKNKKTIIKYIYNEESSSK